MAPLEFDGEVKLKPEETIAQRINKFILEKEK